MKKICIILIILFSIGNISAQVKSIRLNTLQPTQYAKIDISIELIAKWKNPFLQEDIALDMIVTSPSGKQLMLPCFYESGESGKLSVWRAYFAPQETGEYQCNFKLSKFGKTSSISKSQTFRSEASDKNGFLHTKTDWILQFDNGKPFRGIAENICWESRDHDDSKFFKGLHERADIYSYSHMLPDFARNGGNFFRTWICSWNLPIDYKLKNYNNSRYTPADEFYNPSAVAKMDSLIELSESLDLYIMLTLGQGGYSVRDGGVATSSEDFFINPLAKERYKNRLRYIVARWGYSTSIAMWEFFNEVDNVQFGNKNNPIKGEYIVQWHTEMSAYLKKIDPYKHIVTTSISHRDIEGLNSIADIDINQKHIYNNTRVLPSEIWKYTKEFKKPYIIGEFGREWDWSKNFNDFGDEMDVDFKRGLWYGIFSPTPVLPMSWWWEFFDNRWMTTYFRGVREINDRMLAAGNGSFEPLTVKAGDLEAFAVQCGKEVYVYLFNPTNLVFSTDLTINKQGGGKYNIQCFEPTLRLYKDVKGANVSSSGITVKNVSIGSQKEMLYILTPEK